MRWRAGDIVVSCPPRSGTNFTMHMIYQLLSGGDVSFEDLYQMVPWLDFTEYIGQPASERAERWASEDVRRAWKTHLGVPPLKVRDDVLYVVVVRDVRDSIESYVEFMHRQNPVFAKAWGHDDVLDMTLERAVEKWIGSDRYFPFVAGWWPRRHQRNVLMMHFSELKADLRGTLQRLREFAGIEIDDDAFDKAAEHSSFDWMKAHGDKFELRTIAIIDGERVPVVLPGGMIRSGKIGLGRQRLTDVMLAQIEAAERKAFANDAALLQWARQGHCKAVDIS
jgi:aryl sulfotransferase